MKKTKTSRRILSALLTVLLCLSCVGSPAAFAAGADGEITESVEFLDENPTDVESGAEDAQKTDGEKQENPHSDSISADAPQEEPPAESVREEGDNPGKSEVEANFSEAAQSFLFAVAAIDRDAILSAANAWGLAHLAWMQDQDDPDLTAALDAATAASDEAAAVLYAAEDLFYMISEGKQTDKEVQAAYLSLMSIITAMHLAMDNPTVPTEPTDPGTEGGEPTSEDEIAAILYGDLPDAPTGSYMGSYGLPVATGEPKISISAWKTDLMSNDRMDADALNQNDVSITVSLQTGEKYAIVPILTQVEYPATGSSTTVILPDGVTLLSQDGSGREADAEETTAILNAAYNESSAAVSGFFVRANEDFTAHMVYTAPDGTTLEKALDVHVDRDNTNEITLYGLPNSVATYAERPTPAVTTGKVTRVEKVNGTWLIWFNGQPAYCCTHGAHAGVTGCPTYTYAYTSIVGGYQYTPGDHYRNQIEIWGGLGQLSLGLLRQDSAALFSMDDANACYDDLQQWVMEHYPDSVATRVYQDAVSSLRSGAVSYATESDYCATCSATSL